MKKSRILALLLSATLVISAATGCSNSSSSSGSDSNTASGSGTEEPYTVNFMYLAPGTQKDQKLVDDAVNELAMKELNMKVNLIPMSGGEYQQKVQLMLAGGEPLDLFPVFPGNIQNYMASGYLVDMSPLIDKYGKNIKNIFGSDAKIGNLNGFVFDVTMMKEWENPGGFIMRTDVLKKCGIDVSKIKTIDDMTEVFAKVKAQYPSMDVLVGGKDNHPLVYMRTYDDLGDGFGVLTDYGQNTKVVDWYETDEFAHYCKLLRQWYLAGYIKKDMATTTEAFESQIRAGKAFCGAGCLKPNTKAEKDTMCNMDTTIVQVTTTFRTTGSFGCFGYAIAHNSKDPEKAMQFLDWTYGSAEFNNLINWGIEGKHYVYVDKENKIIDFPDGMNVENDPYHIDYGWALPNQFIANIWKGNDPKVWDDYKAFNDNALKSKAYGFYFDSSKMVTQISQLNSIVTKYLNGLGSGSVDPDTTIPKMIKELKTAGIDTVIAEKQKQLDAWLAKTSK
jgi:putative aldouronate transport system substrate-binding protein